MAQTSQNQESVWSVDESPSIKSYTLANLRKLPQIEKFSEQENLGKLSTKVFGWEEKFSITLSEILKSQKNNNIEFVTINFSPNGFLTLEEKGLKTILLGFDPTIIETQLKIICDLKNQLTGETILEKIDNIDLTDPNNPTIKVFKPQYLKQTLYKFFFIYKVFKRVLHLNLFFFKNKHFRNFINNFLNMSSLSS